MLCCGGGGAGGGAVDPELAKINAAAAKQLAKEEAANAKIVKMLLLGAGESGKSTIFKQMKIINKEGFSKKERMAFVDIIHSNVVQNMNMLMEAFAKVQHEMPDELSALKVRFDERKGTEKLDSELGVLIQQMWQHASAREVFERRSEYQLNDSAEYYFNDLDRISAAGYEPDEQDVLRSRVRTTGIVRSDFKIKGLEFCMFDVGGQRNERRKWIHAFDDVNAVVFVAALSEYDQVLFEDETQNRMSEAVSLFEQIINSKWFKETAFILFLNKQVCSEKRLGRAT